MNKWLAKTLVGLGCFALLSAYALAFQDIDHSIYFPVLFKAMAVVVAHQIRS